MRPCSAEKSARRRMMPQLLARDEASQVHRHIFAILSDAENHLLRDPRGERAEIVPRQRLSGLASSIFSTSSWTMATNSAPSGWRDVSEGQRVVVELRRLFAIQAAVK